MPEIRACRQSLVDQLPKFDIQQFDRLETFTLALGHAQTVYQTATEPPASLIALSDNATKMREVLLADVMTLVKRGLIEAAVLDDLKGTNGYKNLAFDLFALANIFRNNWAKISDRTSVETSELDQAEMLADQLITAVGEREQSPAIAALAVRDRQGAFTLFVRAYDEVRTAIMYLRRQQGDADKIAPSLYAGRATPKRKHQPVTPPQPTPNPPSTEVSPTPIAPVALPAQKAHLAVQGAESHLQQ